MTQIKRFIAKHFSSFTYFYRHLRHRIFIAVGLSIAVGVLDGFGLSMFLPLLQMVSDSGASAEGMGNLRFLVDAMENAGIRLTLVSALAFMLVFFTLKAVATFSVSVYNVVLQQYFIRKIRLKLVKSLNQMTFKAFVTSDAGRIQNTMTGEVDRVARAYGSYFQAFQQSILVAVYMGFAFFVDWQFAILVAFGGWLTNILYKIIYKHTKGASRKLTNQNHIYQGRVIQHVGNYKYLRATGLVTNFGDRLRSTIHDIEKSRKKIGMLSSILRSAREPMLIAVVAAVILLQTKLLGGALGPILISLLFFYRALTALTAMQSAWNNYLEVSGSMDNMLDFQKELDGKKQREGKEEVEQFRRAIDLRGVSFAYGEERVLREVDLTVKKNETVAFVGESGSGKTTLVNLLAGLLPPDTGIMTVDGIGREELNTQSYQKRIGYITQEPVVFNDSVFNNVTFWQPRNAENERRCKEALKRAALLQFTLEQPRGLDTQLGNNGINLSGGQKQRISIARELYKDIDILIMDEATSALDSETEKFIQNQIEALHGEYTILVVAHRLSTVKNADRVVLMDKGRIKSIGTFKELVKKEKRFREMVELQEV